VVDHPARFGILNYLYTFVFCRYFQNFQDKELKWQQKEPGNLKKYRAEENTVF
jgi:hypothetical protein